MHKLHLTKKLIKTSLLQFCLMPTCSNSICLACIPLAANVIFNILSFTAWVPVYLREALKPKTVTFISASLVAHKVLYRHQQFIVHCGEKLLGQTKRYRPVKCIFTIYGASVQKGLFWRERWSWRCWDYQQFLEGIQVGNQRAKWNTFPPS